MQYKPRVDSEFEGGFRPIALPLYPGPEPNYQMYPLNLCLEGGWGLALGQLNAADFWEHTMLLPFIQSNC